jgi:hypothetical protein
MKSYIQILLILCPGLCLFAEEIIDSAVVVFMSDSVTISDSAKKIQTVNEKDSTNSSVQHSVDSNIVVDSITPDRTEDTTSQNPDSLDLLAENDVAVVIEGIVIDEKTGNVPSGSVTVQIDSSRITLDSLGEFSIPVPTKPYYNVNVISENYEPAEKVVTFTNGKKNYFLTMQLTKKVNAVDTVKQNSPDTSAVPWTISGTIVDSRFDLVIESDSTVLLFDNDTITVTKHVNFVVTTNISGKHTFYLSIPGYHPVTLSLVLTEEEKQLFVTIPTTITEKTISRREITVSAKRLPVHRSAEISKVNIPRKELQKTTATFNDPVRVLQTLPGVSSESDASARLIVRGGDVNESRAFLDGVTLLQPFHFGGARSMFNQQAMDHLTLYKTGFPAELHNAQSAILEVTSRIPSDEKGAFELDLNPLQYSTYIGLPLFKGKAGLSFSSQGSFQEQILKLILNIGKAFGNKAMGEAARLISMPDYKDFSAGFSLTPSPRLKLFINEIYCSDKVKFFQGDSVVDVTYKYYKDDSLGNRILDTMVTVQQSYYNSMDFNFHNGYVDPLPGRDWEGLPDVGKPRYDIDTLLDYHSMYNILYGNVKYVVSDKSMFYSTLAWQKRSWDLNFPTIENVFDTALYDMNLNQYNLNAGWTYSGMEKHIFKTGIQLDYTKADYNVFIVRFLHHLITEGSTNFSDFWGPVNGDTALVVNMNDESFMSNIMSRIFVAYNGKRQFLNAAFYASDAWDICNKLHLDLGTRIEYSQADRATQVSPRLTVKFNVSEKNELLGSFGLYTQNNYDMSAIALSDDLKPEKVWHATIGAESKFLPWLTQKIDLFGKYYYDLTSEMIDNVTAPTQEEILKYIDEHYYYQYLDTLSEVSMQKLILRTMYDLSRYRTRYTNDGKGTAYGVEYMLRFDPADFWFGWISLTLENSTRQRHEHWKKHPFPLDRPLLISVNNYYRLPRKYEISIKYRYMSGTPYTSFESNRNFTRVGSFNDRRFAAYHRLDIRFSKGFSVRNAKGNFYTEIWNAMNAPNLFGRDSKTKKFVTIHSNLPVTMLYVGTEISY